MGVEETKTLEITHLKVHFSRNNLKYCISMRVASLENLERNV